MIMQTDLSKTRRNNRLKDDKPFKQVNLSRETSGYETVKNIYFDYNNMPPCFLTKRDEPRYKKKK